MGDTGPCGPSSEIFWDLGPEFGPDGGPVTDADRYIEIWNLVFMQFDQQADGTRAAAAEAEHRHRRGARTQPHGRAGQDVDLGHRRVPPAARGGRSAPPARNTGRDERTDVSLRIIAEHARTMTFMVERRRAAVEPGARLRAAPDHPPRGAARVPARRARPRDAGHGRRRRRRAWATRTRDLRHARRRPQDRAPRGGIASGPRSNAASTCSTSVVATGDVSGDDAFFLHDTLGFPIDLTREIAGERGRQVDLAGFETRMQEQRERARAAAERSRRRDGALASTLYRELVDEHGPTEFTGRQEYASTAKVLALVGEGERVGQADEGMKVDVVLDRTPFYAESGGQVGDTGTITTAPGAIVDVRRHAVRAARPGHRARRACRVRLHRGGRRGPAPRSTVCAATASAATTPRPTCCTGRCARCSARTCSRRVRSSRPTGCASTSRTTSRSPPTSSPRSSASRTRR